MKQGVPRALRHLEDDLASLARAGQRRYPPEPATRPATASFCSNDYLGLAATRDDVAPMGAGASRLVSGEHREHGRLERALADWLGVRSAVLFTSGYAANVGLLPALADGASDLILSDALNHASIVDGCRLARARTRVFPHLDHDAVRALLREAAGQTRRRWVVTESYFSMDADSPDLVALRELCDDNDAALVVDEAHALGVLGPAGRGLCAEADVVPDVLVGTLGKAFGAGGAFVAGCDELTAWLWNRARSFVFSTGLSPAVAEAALAALRTIDRDPTLRADTAGRAEQLRGGLLKLGYSPLGYGHIVPIVVGDSEEAVRLAERVSQEGFTVRAIRPPSVPDGTARIRFTASARQSPADIETLLGVLADRGLGRFT